MAEVLKSIKPDNVPQSFARIQPDGEHVEYVHLPYYANLAVDHVQGLTKTCIDGKEYSILTHSGGWLILKDTPGCKQCKEVKISLNLDHPGGSQAIGQFVFVPCEYQSKSTLLIYDISKDNPSVVKSIEFEHAASSCGITDIEVDGRTRYVLAMNANPTCYFYISKETDETDMSKIEFEELGQLNLNRFSGEDDDFEGIGLVTDTNNQIFLIAFFSRTEHLTYADYAMLLGIEINISESKKSVTGIQYETKHLVSHGGVSGVAGIHCRWGTGIFISEQRKLCLLATARNILSRWYNMLDTDIWAER